MATATAVVVAAALIVVANAALFEGHALYKHLPWSCMHGNSEARSHTCPNSSESGAHVHAEQRTQVLRCPSQQPAASLVTRGGSSL